MKTSVLAVLMLATASFLKAEEPTARFDDFANIFSNWQRQRRTIAADDPRLTFFANVTNLWWQGHKSNVLAIAEQRLACNSNDIAGLILKMEYDFSFLNLDSVSNSIQRVLDCGNTISTTNYASSFPFFKFSLEHSLHVFTIESMYEDIDAERAKALLPEKRMSFERHLFAVCLDGLVTNYPALTPPGGTDAP